MEKKPMALPSWRRRWLLTATILTTLWTQPIRGQNNNNNNNTSFFAQDSSLLLLAPDNAVDLQVGTTTRRTISTPQDGDRTYYLHIPSGMVDPPALVLDWHWFLVNSDFHKATSGMQELADERKNFIVAFPQSSALLNAFNAGDPCCGILAAEDDLWFAQAIIEDIKNSIQINPRRIYSYGYSQGGAMSAYLSYKIPEHIAAISTNAFSFIPEHYEEALEAKETNPNFHPVPVLAIHGYNDFLFCWSEKCISNIAFPSFNSAKEGWHRWAELNECPGEPVTLEEKPRTFWSQFNRDHDDYWWIKAYQNCADGVEVQQILNSNSHIGDIIFMGKPGFLAQKLVVERIVDFFMRWTLPERIQVTEPDWWNNN